MFFIVLSCIFVSPLFTSEVMTHTKWAATWYHLMHISYSLRQNHFVDIVSVQICYLAIVCKFVHTYIIYIFDFSVLPASFSKEHFSYLTCLWKISITYTLLRHSMSMSWKFWHTYCISLLKYSKRFLSYACPFPFMQEHKNHNWFERYDKLTLVVNLPFPCHAGRQWVSKTGMLSIRNYALSKITSEFWKLHSSINPSLVLVVRWSAHSLYFNIGVWFKKCRNLTDCLKLYKNSLHAL